MSSSVCVRNGILPSHLAMHRAHVILQHLGASRALLFAHRHRSKNNKNSLTEIFKLLPRHHNLLAARELCAAPAAGSAAAGKLHGHVAIITGSGNGIGEACARKFASEGCGV